MENDIKFSDTKYEACLVALKEESCCNEVQQLVSKRNGGKYQHAVPSTISAWYFEKCDNYDHCSSFDIISTENYHKDATATDNTFVTNNGSLQFNARTVSNNNLFPNNNNASNWHTAEAQNVIQHIQSVGDGIFAQDPEYHVTMNAQCVTAIKKYNQDQENSGSDYNNGGFNDFTQVVTNAVIEARDDNEANRIGTRVVMSENFYKLLKENCGFKFLKENGSSSYGQTYTDLESAAGRTESQYQDKSKVRS